MNFYAKYTKNGVQHSTNKIKNADFEIKIDDSNSSVKCVLIPNSPISFQQFDITLKQDFDLNSKVFCNGYQSWTISREYSIKEKMDDFSPTVLGIKKKNVNPIGIWGAGDLTFHEYPTKKGIFYGYSYSYIKNGKNIKLFGSLNERVGYTILTFNVKESSLTISKDLDGATYDDETELLNLAIIEDEYDNAFDKYFEMLNIQKPRFGRKTGYTTWYNYYTNVNENIVNRDLKSIVNLDNKLDVFQIDDGYERAVGDWIEYDKVKFPNGMKTVADAIHNENMIAGLWLAPFAAIPKSNIFRNHRDWFVKNDNDRMQFASHNWGGFFALDIYNEEVRAYLKNVFDTIFNDWGYDMVKLDFLYACSIIPIHGKTRGEIMDDAMILLRELCGDKIILGCGVPLFPAFGRVDYCRIGCDMALDWNKKPFSREDVSTKNTLLNTIFRRHLDGRAFLNDPDVFLFREKNIKMDFSQRRMIAKIDSLFGNVLFTSDDVSTYDQLQKRIFTRIMTSYQYKVLDVVMIRDRVVKVDYIKGDQPKTLILDINTGRRVVK